MLDVLYILKIILSLLVVAVDIFLLIPMFKLKVNIKILYLQFLFSSIFDNFYMCLEGLEDLNIQIHCYFMKIFQTFTENPMLLSLLSITLNSYFILTNNFFYQRKKQTMLLIMLIITWIPTIIILILFLIVSKLDPNVCRVQNPMYRYLQFIPQITIEVITITVCLILTVKVCSLKTENDKELQISKKKTISKIVHYIIGILFGFILKNLIYFIVKNQFVKNILFLLLPIYLFVLNYLFVWSKQFHETILDTYCCKDKEETKEVLMNDNQKELIFQHNYNEEELETSNIEQ